MFQFDWPLVFLALPLPLVAYFFLPKAKHEVAALKAPFFNRLNHQQHAYGSTKQNINLARIVLLSAVWVSIVSAAAKPEWIGDPISLPASGRDLLVAVDISGSMKTADMIIDDQQIARVLIVKMVVGDFLKQRESDRLGLILFGTNAYLQAPLTFDRATVNQLLQEAQLGFAGEQTAIGDAIGLAIKRLKDRPDAQRVLILLTDGANTAGEVTPRRAAELAATENVKIYTVGIGADEMTVQRGIFNRFQQKVNPSADLDEDTLQYIADTTGGQYFRARNPEELESIYQRLDELEPIEQEAEIFRPISALFYIPLALSFIFSFILAATVLLPTYFGMRKAIHSVNQQQA